MKILYFGGQKSGKSTLAEAKTLSMPTDKPIYLATYDNTFNDAEMANKITKHKLTRGDDFVTIEEAKYLSRVIKSHHTYLVDCLSMWILNRMDEEEEELIGELQTLANIDANIVFVLNDVSGGVIPNDPISRRFVDLSGLIGQAVARLCDEVYEVKLGMEVRLK